MSYEEEIQRLCIQLKLGQAAASMAPDLGKKEAEAVQKILSVALQDRRANHLARLLKKSHLDASKTLRNYEFGSFEVPKSITLDELCACSFVPRAENLILFGAPGTGKTHLANSLGFEALQRKFKVYFENTTTFVNWLVAAFRDGQANEVFKILSRIDLLILDEWGYIPTDPIGSQLLFRVINDFYEKRSIILTTNLSFSEWGSIFGDKKLTNAALDRMIHHSHFFNFTGESWRVRNSLMSR